MERDNYTIRDGVKIPSKALQQETDRFAALHAHVENVTGNDDGRTLENTSAYRDSYSQARAAYGFLHDPKTNRDRVYKSAEGEEMKAILLGDGENANLSRDERIQKAADYIDTLSDAQLARISGHMLAGKSDFVGVNKEALEEYYGHDFDTNRTLVDTENGFKIYYEPRANGNDVWDIQYLYLKGSADGQSTYQGEAPEMIARSDEKLTTRPSPEREAYAREQAEGDPYEPGVVEFLEFLVSAALAIIGSGAAMLSSSEEKPDKKGNDNLNDELTDLGSRIAQNDVEGNDAQETLNPPAKDPSNKGGGRFV